ncbi:MAG: tRNA (N6-isopentenyl adenosine(37)-C2)-methylthiotransferase MiaB [Acidimicrobiia bacterium]|nr:tRNA (N6-isopentenyl adenosine(37)-C2)-methylthiotransferase MiaB [Acidimicrobiia bacterium]
MADATALGMPSVRTPRAPQRIGQSYHIRTFGCQMNEHDSERIGGLLTADGMVATPTLEEADVVVLNTCTIRENADNKLYGFLGALRAVKNRRPGMKILVGGCSAQKDGDLVMERARWVDAVFGTHNVHRVVDLLDHVDEWGPVTEIWEETTSTDDFPSYLPAQRETPHSAWVTIAIGCDNSCTFCIVPTVRGREISRRVGDVIGEVRSLAADGVTEITLLGQNVNSYGRDLELNGRRPVFADLLRQVGAVEGIRRVRYTSPHPKDFKEDVALAMAKTKSVCEQLHLPLQSGSDRILAAMHRGYNASRFLSRLEMARDIVPNLAVSTDIIVGFPGETEDDFAATMDVVAAARFDQAFTFQYSPRPGTPAATMGGQIPKEIVQDRFDRLVTLQNQISLEKNEAAVGGVEEVLVEGPSKKDPTVMTARTRGNKPVHAPGRYEPGTYLRAEITQAAPHHLLGRVIS